ncbi:MAG: MTH1187 family thiamine-binding protein [Candidatus Thiodiazotropha sp. (ex Lucina aurantia)]|nr:MTH1187 family thiamine-binding protein [Candidatus Thiodiazotropha sp. (ex Lucina pensylvanica)]MBT3015407.1 MTH1187 family thiamine-binding protein [Candidatus Thiodiazotropha taylori]MBT3052379.1 MTH1187 family thiamine-binding protein [Candidatus Thiodiazotropha sp. (ex Codakia orbicularis)]MBV2102045.1 MTH1187 family thiamine-binding protein [Candidatus Thiodiazotropha sp. (ex Lucina aurantia)]MBT3022358.1 MTH1187 family thiamine-binding protein [Candidatus Thiodiazotropha taylori]
MSVLLEFSIFPLDKGVSVSEEVSRVIEMIDSTGTEYQLTAMGTLIETPNITEALAIVEQAALIIHGAGCQRVYAAIKIDSRPAREHGLQGKIESIQKRLGEVNLNPGVESD